MKDQQDRAPLEVVNLGPLISTINHHWSIAAHRGGGWRLSNEIDVVAGCLTSLSGPPGPDERFFPSFHGAKGTKGEWDSNHG